MTAPRNDSPQSVTLNSEWNRDEFDAQVTRVTRLAKGQVTSRHEDKTGSQAHVTAGGKKLILSLSVGSGITLAAADVASNELIREVLESLEKERIAARVAQAAKRLLGHG
jgi:hypothetical protein